MNCKNKNLVIPNSFHSSLFVGVYSHVTWPALHVTFHLYFLNNTSESLDRVYAIRSVHSIQTQTHVCWQFVLSVYDNLTGLKLVVGHGWIFIQQLSRCGQPQISKSYLSCVKSVWPASNQPLHPQGNIMWHLSKPLQHVTPPTQLFFEKSGIFHAARIHLSDPFYDWDIFTSPQAAVDVQICKQSRRVWVLAFVLFYIWMSFFLVSSFCQIAPKPIIIINVFVSECQPRTLYFLSLIVLKQNVTFMPKW